MKASHFILRSRSSPDMRITLQCLRRAQMQIHDRRAGKKNGSPYKGSRKESCNTVKS